MGFYLEIKPNNKYDNNNFPSYCEMLAPSYAINFSINFNFTEAGYCQQYAPDFSIGATKFQLNSINFILQTFEFNSFYTTINQELAASIDFGENIIALNTPFYSQVSKFEERNRIDYMPIDFQLL